MEEKKEVKEQTEVKKPVIDKKKVNAALKKTKKVFINKEFNVFKALYAALITPMKFHDEAGEKMANPKNTCVFIGVMAVGASVLAVLLAFIGAIFTSESCVWGYCVKVSFAERLGNIGWWSLIWQNFLFPVIIIFSLASIFYMGVLVAKKKMDYMRMVGFTAVAFLPYLVSSIVLSPILGSIWTQLSLIINLTAGLYSLTLFFNFVRYESSFKDKSDGFMYYCLACFGVVAVVIYLVVYQLFSSFLAGIL